VLEGQQLAVTEAAPAAEGPAAAAQAAAGSVTYLLSQPPFQLLTRWDSQPTLPELSQVALDQERETAPVD
jgi:hypothetical protein